MVANISCRQRQRCRVCDSALSHVMCDLGLSPLANSYLLPEEAQDGELLYPLKVLVCQHCLLAQLDEYESPAAIFSDYAYFSSVSESWVEHARLYCEMMIERFGLNQNTRVVEIASNDGYLLQHFIARGIPVLGVEPAANVAKVAEAEKGVRSLVAFFGRETAERIVLDEGRADLLLGNNVLAHVPDINDFVDGLKLALAPEGVMTFEFPHLLRLMERNQFDTIYHEHYSYLSLHAVKKLFESRGLVIFDVDELETHGGSIRIYATHADSRNPKVWITPKVAGVIAEEVDFGLPDMETYGRFKERSERVKRDLLRFLINAKEADKSVVGYGAAAKGVTLLNYCGIRGDLVEYVVDKSPHKQGRLVPGVRMPIYPIERVFETRPDYLLVLPWNLRREISGQMQAIRDWGGKFVVPIPGLEVF